MIIEIDMKQEVNIRLEILAGKFYLVLMHHNILAGLNFY